MPTAACCCARSRRLRPRRDGASATSTSTVIAEAPKLAPHVPAMRANLAGDLACGVGAISVKATTTERLGFAGRGEGIAALATVLLVRS